MPSGTNGPDRDNAVEVERRLACFLDEFQVILVCVCVCVCNCYSIGATQTENSSFGFINL